MCAVITKLHSSWKWVVLIKSQVSYNELHCIYGELQVSFATQIELQTQLQNTIFSHNDTRTHIYIYQLEFWGLFAILALVLTSIN
jgi:hypothetical protein